MQHFKEFIIKLQTIDIKINQRKLGNSNINLEKFYDISHENPFLSPSFKNEMKQLRELALTDILLLQREQIVFQVQRLGDLKDKFRKFWVNYNNSYLSPQNEYISARIKYSTDFFSSLGLHDIFIAPHSSRAPIGYLAITEIPVAINQGYIAIIADKLISKYFIYLWCKANMPEIESAGNGSVFQEISKSTFKELEFIIPSKDKLEFFDKEVESMFQKIKSNTRQIKTLITLRDILLPKLMNGEVRVKM